MKIVVNFKTYIESTNSKAIELAREIDKFAKDSEHEFVLCPQLIDIQKIKEEVEQCEVWAQHVNPISPGRNTGYISPFSLKEHNVSGSLINHSEHKVGSDLANQTILKLDEYAIDSCLCFSGMSDIDSIKDLNPTYFAWEPDELISTGRSIFEYGFDMDKILSKLPAHRVFIGAGISERRDVELAESYGFSGIVISSAIVKSEDRIIKLKELFSSN